MSVFAQNCNSSVSCALPTDYHTASSDLYLSIKPRALLAKAVGTKAAGFALPTKSLMQGDWNSLSLPSSREDLYHPTPPPSPDHYKYSL